MLDSTTPHRRISSSRILGFAAALIAGWSLGALPALAQGLLSEGDAVITQFSGLGRAGDGTPRPDPDGAVLQVFGLGDLRGPADGSLRAPQLLITRTAQDLGQVFAATADGAEPANIYVAASSAFGLFRTPGGEDWAAGMWGPEGGPGTVWKLDAGRNYRAEPFAQIGFLDEPNAAAGLGGLVYDPWHDQLIVADLESGLVHRLAAEDGELLESFDHGVDGRSYFLDAASGEHLVREAVSHDPSRAPRFDDCAVEFEGAEDEAAFDSTPECWNYADFRRRIWGLGVVQDPDDEQVRLYYAVWGGAALGSPDWAGAGADARTSIWSVALSEDGWFDATDVRREIVLPPLAPVEDDEGPVPMPPVTDIAFAGDGTMILAERGLPMPIFDDEASQLVEPHGARVLRLSRDDAGRWRIDGRYDAGRPEGPEDGPPLRANAAGGVGIGPGYGPEGRRDGDRPGATVWMSIARLCDEAAPCTDAEGEELDIAGGLQATPLDEIAALHPAEPAPPQGLDRSYLLPVRGTGALPGDVGDVEIYRGVGPPPRIVARPEPVPPPEAEEEEEDVAVDEPPEAELEIEPIEAATAATDLALAVEALEECRPGEDCDFEIDLTNAGDVPYDGPLHVTATPRVAGVALVGARPEAWRCERHDGRIYCHNEAVRLAPGDSETIALTLRPDAGHWQPTLEHCAALIWLGRAGRERIRAVQAELNRRGFDAGVVDGVMGPRTASAIRDAEAEFELAATGEIGGALVEAMFGAGAYLAGDANPETDEDCAAAEVDVPPEAAHQRGISAFHQSFDSRQHDPATTGRAPAAPPAPPPAARHDRDLSHFHTRRVSAQHNPVTSGPTPIHRPDFSQFHARYRSNMHDGTHSGVARMHDSVISNFHRRYDSRAHDIETSGPIFQGRPRHDGWTSRWR